MSFLNKNLTVVIPCKNEKVGIASTLLKLIVTHDVRNIIIADSSDDNTLVYVDMIQHLSDIDIKVVKGGLPAAARNNGFKEVKTPYVLFLDADMDVSKLPLKQMVAAMINRDIKIATCNISTWNLKYALFYKLFDLVQWIISFKTPFAVGGFMLFNSEYFKELGQFNEEDKFAEDYHLSMKAKPKYFKIFNYYAYTSDRRFKNKGFWYMCKLMIRCWLNRNNDDFYKQDYNYWS
jgi:glycosyltransferase involved in cell wall biosynthesis